MEALQFRLADINDLDTYFGWVNDSEVRERSFCSDSIVYKDHVEWFSRKLKEENTVFLLFSYGGVDIGQVRIELAKEGLINFSIDSNFRGRGFAAQMLKMSAVYFFKLEKKMDLIGYVKKSNIPSAKAFERAGFFKEELEDKLLYRLREL